MTYHDIDAALRACGLTLRGGLHPKDGGGTVLLVGPEEPGFWSRFSNSLEYNDNKPDPLDRWSKRVLGELANRFSAQAVFPSDGPPYPPFIHWALHSGQAWQSPVELLVHSKAGMFISYRGALVFEDRLALPDDHKSPCDSCDAKPCLTACPVSALSGSTVYDVPKCQEFLHTSEGLSCKTQGCRVRRACPVSAGFGREREQSAFHMRAFLGE